MAQIVDSISAFFFFAFVLPVVFADNSTNASSTFSSIHSSYSTLSSVPTSSLLSTPMQTHSKTVHFTSTISRTSSASGAVMNSTTAISPTAPYTSTSVYSTTSINVTTARPPTTSIPCPAADCHSCEERLASERSYKWAAVSFDLIFVVALVVMTIMYLRLRRLYKDLEGDGSLSRLI